MSLTLVGTPEDFVESLSNGGGSGGDDRPPPRPVAGALAGR